MIATGLRTLLLGDSNITAIIGTRLYPIQLPQKPTLPALTYFRVSGEEQASNSGSQDYGWARFQIDAWAETFNEAETLANLVKERLHGFSGTVSNSDSPPLSWVFQGIFAMTMRDFYEPEPKQYRVSRDYMMWFVD